MFPLRPEGNEPAREQEIAVGLVTIVRHCCVSMAPAHRHLYQFYLTILDHTLSTVEGWRAGRDAGASFASTGP